MSTWLVKDKDRVVDKIALLDKQCLIFGRSQNADIMIDNPSVSRQHASFERQGNRIILTDLKSSNGTLVNGREIKKPVLLNASDKIQIGKFLLVPATSSSSDGYSGVRHKQDRIADPAADKGVDETFYIPSKAHNIVANEERARKLSALKGSVTPKTLDLKGKNEYFIGKNPLSSMQIKGWLVGNVKCSIRFQDNTYYLKPQPDSKPPTLNNETINEMKELNPGDIIGIGGAQIRFE